MRKIDLLKDLQELDSALDRARGELEQIRARLGDNSELAPLRQERDSARQQLRRLQQKGQELEWDLEQRMARRKADEQKLYGGSIKSPKELSSLAHEVELERERISRLEDQVLMNLDEIERASALLAAAERSLAEKEEVWRAEQAEMEGRAALLAREVEDLTSRRQAVAGQVDPATLRIYESIRRSRGGLAVADVEQRACQGCRISLSSSEVQRARSSPDFVTCQSCGRILYVPG